MSELDESIGQVESLIPKQQIPGQGQRRSSNRSALLIIFVDCRDARDRESVARVVRTRSGRS